MKVTSKVKMDFPRIKELTQASVKALEMTAEVLHTEVKDAEVVPMESGNLTGESFYCDYVDENSGKVSLVHSTPYARRMYYHPEYRFQTEYHANARGEWFEDWLEGGKNEGFAVDTFQKFFKQEGDV